MDSVYSVNIVLKGITANEELLESNMLRKVLELLTAVNPHIGYEAASRIAREAIDRKIC